MDFAHTLGLNKAPESPEEERAKLQLYINLKLASSGQPTCVPEGSSRFFGISRDLLYSYREKNRLLSNYHCRVDQRIQGFIKRYVEDLDIESIPTLPTQTFILDRHGVARELSLPMGEDEFSITIEDPGTSLDVGKFRDLDVCDLPNADPECENVESTLGEQFQAHNDLPDFSVRYRNNGDFGHYQVAGMLRAVARGWAWVYENREAGVDLLVEEQRHLHVQMVRGLNKETARGARYQWTGIDKNVRKIISKLEK